MAEPAEAAAFAPPARDVRLDEMDAESLRKEVERVWKENEQLLDDKARLSEEVETLKSRCQKLAKMASAPPQKAPSSEAAIQTECAALLDSQAASVVGGDTSAIGADGAEVRIPPTVLLMLQSPKDEAVQTQGIEALFAQQTQASDSVTATPAANQAALEVAVAILRNHPGNQMLLLKASQFLSVMLQERGVQQQLPASALLQAAREVVRMSDRILAQVVPGDSESSAQVGTQSATKLLTWFLMLLAYIFPCLESTLRDERQSGDFVLMLLQQLITPLLASAEVSMLKCVYKCVDLLPLLPMEHWIQKACLDNGTAHSLAATLQRCKERGSQPDAVPKFQAAIMFIFAENPELCVRAIGDEFVNDDFVCLQVLEELGKWEAKQRRSFRTLDEKWGVIDKALDLWAAHQRTLLEAADPQKCGSREVLQKVAELMMKVLAKLPPQRLLQRLQKSVDKEFPAPETLQRLVLATTQANAQLRLQLAVNYGSNNVGTLVISTLQNIIRRFYTDVDQSREGKAVEGAFRLLQDDKLPAEGWAYLEYGLEICLHILAHWSAAKLALPQKGRGSDGFLATAAPRVLAQGGLVDVLAEIIDPAGAGEDLVEKPPSKLNAKAVDTLQQLFEQSSHVCLFCMKHYAEVKQMISLGCDSLVIDPLVDFPDMQKQAVEQLAESFEKFQDEEKLCRKILKALSTLFESSHRLVAWFLQSHPLANLGELQAADVHVEACRAVSRVPYWSIEDAEDLPAFVKLIAELLLESIKGLNEAPPPRVNGKAPRRVLDLNEAEEVVANCVAVLLHLLLIDPSPPTVLRCLVESLGDGCRAEDVGSSSEAAVDNVMKVMQVFPSSDPVQTNCQHLLTSLLGE